MGLNLPYPNREKRIHGNIQIIIQLIIHKVDNKTKPYSWESIHGDY